jgi:hypothetical protein
MLTTFWLGLRLLLLIGAANVAPIVAKRVLGARWNAPLDGGLRFFDGRPLLGSSKTVRGLVAAVATATLGAAALGIPLSAGALIGAAAMSGDALSSFVTAARHCVQRKGDRDRPDPRSPAAVAGRAGLAAAVSGFDHWGDARVLRA